MRTVELVKGIQSSVLGFGCAPILGSVDANAARRGLEVALDCGITHFDVARSYGYGEAEQFLGKVLKGRRQQVVLASKFGIKANWKAKLLSPIKPMIRLLKKDKGIENATRKESSVINGTNVSDKLHDRVPLRGSQMRKNLEISLRALQTDYLDYFFLHEPLESVAQIDELSYTAELLKQEGKIRAWGLAYMKSQEHLHKDYLKCFDVLQFNCSPGITDYDTTLEKRGLEPNILFSPLRGGSELIKPSEKLLTLFHDFPNSVILCSMFSEKHMISNVALAG